MLSGYELVARGTTKFDTSLPEVGLKEVKPNGSWLEQKQIQSALEARKNLIEVERIEKYGSLSHAEWREELMLAEVVQKAGGYWQYLGHNVGKQLFLNPEEALYLMEVNCLQLKHNDVTVSLQQAYTLLLRSKITLTQYKVYSSLSRLGYRVFRHEYTQSNECEEKVNLGSCKNNCEVESSSSKDDNGRKSILLTNEEEKVSISQIDNSSSENLDSEGTSMLNKERKSLCQSKLNTVEEITDIEQHGCATDNRSNMEHAMDVSSDSVTPTYSPTSHNTSHSIATTKLEMLQSRMVKPTNAKELAKHFQCIPVLLQKQRVTIQVPEEKHIPKNIFLNKISYDLDIHNIQTNNKDTRTPSVDSNNYSPNEEVNGAHVRRIRYLSANNLFQNNWRPHTTPNINFRPFMTPNIQFRPFYTRSRMGFFPFHVTFQQPLISSVNFVPGSNNIFPRPPPLIPIYGRESNNSGSDISIRKRTRHAKTFHLEAIKNFAARLKLLIHSGNPQTQNVATLQKLIQTYNARYKTRVCLTDQFAVINNENIIDTIELEDDEEIMRKRRKTDGNGHYEEHLNALKQLALKLKELEHKKECGARHRRAFSTVVKRFNKTHDADIHISNTYEVFDRKHIILHCSSESDSDIEEIPETSNGKMLRNPFSILKKLSENINNIPCASTSQQTSNQPKDVNPNNNKYSQFIEQTFNKNWLPAEEDFGRAEVLHRNQIIHRFLDVANEKYIYDFIKSEGTHLENWLEVKISYFNSLKDATESQIDSDKSPGNHSIITPEDCVDVPTVLKKLRIISTCKDIDCTSRITIDFDVYNRDVQNFRKSNRPKPHFRIVCVDEDFPFPSGRDVASLHAKYEDKITILFAAVGIGSIAYLQVNPIDLPVYIPSNSLS